jgi:hypothetical protein
MSSNTKEYARKYYEKNKQKLKEYYKNNKEQFKKNYEKTRDKLINTDSEHYKIFLDYLNLICDNIEDNNYLIDSNIYQNNLIKKYIDDNINIFKEYFYFRNWSQMIKSKKLANQILKRMCKVLSIETKNVIKSCLNNNKKPSSHSYILISI